MRCDSEHDAFMLCEKVEDRHTRVILHNMLKVMDYCLVFAIAVTIVELQEQVQYYIEKELGGG